MPLLVKRKSIHEANENKQDRRSQQQLRPSTADNLSPESTIRAVSDHGTSTFSRPSHELHPDDIVEPSTDDEGSTSRPKKLFSFMKLRNYSESHLSARARLNALAVEEEEHYDMPPVPTFTADNGVLPKIVKTAPTMDNGLMSTQHEERRNVRPLLFKRVSSRRVQSPWRSTDAPKQELRSGPRWRRGKTSGLDDLHRLSTMHLNNNNAPPSYGDESTSALAVPVSRLTDPRLSESSRSDGSNGSSGDIYGSTTTTTHTVSTYTTFFKLPRRNKNRNSLFPVPTKSPPPDLRIEDGPITPRASTQSNTPENQGTPVTDQQSAPQRRHTETSPTRSRPHANSAPPNAALTRDPSFADFGHPLDRHNSQRSQSSLTSAPLQPPMTPGVRDRSSTASSFGQSSRDVDTPRPLSASGRNSTSTTGRSSLGGFLSLSRFRQSSDPHSPRHGSPGTRSKSNSFAISREALVIPEREEGDTPGKYLERLEAAVSRSVIATILSRSTDPFSMAVLRSYSRRFAFFGEPIDMSFRKFLLEAELPKETQQVDRVIQAFADRYHECNPGIFPNSEVAYVVAFSIMMLHTDAFNKNVKKKMTKEEYTRNLRGQELCDDILSCIYDNICYTPFVHYDEDVDINGEKVLTFKAKHRAGKLKSAIPGADVVAKKPSGPLDPYNLLVENRLDELRPPIKDAMMLDDPYDYRGSQGELDMQYLQRAFTHTGILQIISARSRPAAYESQVVNGAPNLTETQQGIVDLKVTKVGTLWRKSAKRSKTKRPWQEWGAILTGSQLYLFKNSHWAKGLMHQFKQHQKPGQPRTPVVFKPPLHDLKPDAFIKTDNAVALVDSTYDKHKNAFVFVRPGAEEEVLLADNESELNEWLGLINYAAAFRAAGVRIRGMVGNEEDTRNRELGRLDSITSTRSIQTRMGEVTLTSRGLSPALQNQVMAARREIMIHKVADLETQVAAANRQLEKILRDARHLQILAPITDKTRDNVCSAGGRINAAIIWTRRDVWRMKCHRDIIAMDVRLDGMTAAELEKLAAERAQRQAEAEAAKKDKSKRLSRLSSQRVMSPPQSPIVRQAGERPSTAESVDTIGRDIFQSPSGSTTSQQPEGWQMPRVSLDVATRDQHRLSLSNTLLSTPTSKRAGGSLTHSSSTSSVLRIQRTHSSNPPELNRESTSDNANLGGKDLQLLARSNMGPAQEPSPRMPSIDNPQLGTSPEGKHKGVRRSLHKTLRDGHHRDHTHKHRRNKDSDSTIRSGGHLEKDMEEATPGLQRDKPRFILHGKQASVVQFGGDWDRMRRRREQYDSQHPGTSYQTQKQADDAYTAYERRRSEQERVRNSVVQDFSRHGSIMEDDDAASVLSEETGSFREDAEAAIAYSSAARSASPKRLSSSTDDRATDSDFYDLAGWEDSRRQTVIGPSKTVAQPTSTETQRHRRYSSLEKDEDGNVKFFDLSDDEDDLVSPTWKVRENRQTVIGPSSSSGDYAVTNPSNGKGKVNESASLEASGSRNTSGTSALGGASPTQDEDFDFEESVEGESGFVRPVDEEELHSMSSRLRAVKTR